MKIIKTRKPFGVGALSPLPASKATQTVPRSFSTVVALLTVFLLLSCPNSKDEGELTVLGPDGGFTYFKGSQNAMADCGKATPRTTAGSGSTGSTSKDVWDIESYFLYTYGEFIFTRFTYDKNRSSYSLTPSTTTTSTCKTSDGIKCDGLGAITCETADSVNCGGTKSFIFAGGTPHTVFQAITGTIDYQLYVDEKSNTVQSADLEFEMVDRTGRVLKGEIHCYAR